MVMKLYTLEQMFNYLGSLRLLSIWQKLKPLPRKSHIWTYTIVRATVDALLALKPVNEWDFGLRIPVLEEFNVQALVRFGLSIINILELICQLLTLEAGLPVLQCINWGYG